MTRNQIAIHDKSKSYDWDYTFGDQTPKWETRYNIPTKGRDPFRMLVRDYMKMEAEKDDRTYGFLDGLVRTGEAGRIEPRLQEAMKMVLPLLTNAEFQAVGACGMIISSIQNQEMRQGYAAQMVDEMRHTQLEMALRNYYVKHADDPSGWDWNQRGLYQHPAGHVSLSLFQGFNTGDPMDCIACLNVITEIAYTNILLVAMPQMAVLNGDNALATTVLSIQSDESRHMANGYGSLMNLVQDESNVPLLNTAIERFFWHNHRGLDAAVGWGSEYGAVHRPWAYKDAYQEWVVDDFVGGFMDRMGEFGLTPPKCLGKVVEATNWIHHTLGLVLAAAWPLNFFRSDAMRPTDFEWFESHYPGWSAVYQPFWEGYAQMLDPSCGHLMLQELPSLPPFCQVCRLPCAMPHPGANEFHLVEVDGKQWPVCSDNCGWMMQTWPGAYKRGRQFWEKYHGWDLADAIVDLGLIRPDGKTLMGQPSLDLERLWTINDIRRVGYEIKDPLHGVL
jgi:methane monooxygenase component A alpha chain/propane monooxygenase large subunit